MPTPDTLRCWDRDHLWHPFTAQADWAASDPLIVARGEGVYLFDVEGRRYLDGVGSLWCNVHGHRHPALDAAVRDQLERMAHSTLLGASHPGAIELARQLVERAPVGLTRVFFSDDGATAVEVALKMAFQYWRQKDHPEPSRTKFLALEGAYHGDTLGDVSVGGVERFHAMFSPLLFSTLRAPSPHCYRCPLSLTSPSCGMLCQGSCEWHVAPGKSFREAQKIGRNLFLFASEKRSRAAEANGDLVGDEKGVVFSGELAKPSQITLGMNNHPGRALNQGFDDDRHNFPFV